MSETEAQFVPFSSCDRSAIVKKPSLSLRLEGELHTNPEYKDSFKNFPRERPVVRKPTGNLQHDPKTLFLLVDEPFKRPRGPGRQTVCNFRSENRIDTNPEHSSSNADLKTVTRRPREQSNQNVYLRDSESKVPRAQSERRHKGKPDVEAASTTNVYYIARERTPSWRRRPEDNLRVAGSSSLAAAVSSPQVSRRRSVSTRVNPATTDGPGVYHAVSRDELASRSKAVTFELGGGRPKTCPRWNNSKVTSTQDANDSKDLPVTDIGSDEPKFRLHVMNVDEKCDENDDFARRRRRGRRLQSSRSSPPHPVLSTSIVSSRAPSPEAAHQFPTPPQVQYPLHQLRQNNSPAFVVLDDLNNNRRVSQAPTALPRSNFLEIPASKQQPRHGSGHKWMPSWHDAPTSI